DEKAGEYVNVYISVFPTLGEEGILYDLSSFDITAYWDKKNPVLDANIQFLPKNMKVDDYVMRTPNATIRVRGNRGASPKSYRVKILDGVYAYRGQAVFNLNKNLRDPSRIANKLAHDLIKNLDNIAGFRTDFLNVFIKDASASGPQNEFYSYGLYTHIEQPNRAYLRAHGLDEKGSIYRAENFNFQLAPQLKDVNDPDYSEQEFETVLAIRKSNDHSKLLSMLKDLNDPAKDFNEVFYTYFNEENYLTWLAVNILLGNADAASKGFLLYNPSNLPVWYLLPWDFDGIFLWMKDEAEIPGFLDKINDVTLHKKYLDQEGNLEKLRDKVNELALGPFSSKKVKSLLKSYKPVLLELINIYPDNVSLGIPVNIYMAFIDRIDEYIMKNYQDFTKWYEDKKTN
ncbi:MAG TPA: CotH kinase family protein, partial [Mobilitalea sp.]|nr:CotH kinase family protein [Mobilitalea sp.]